MKLGKRIIALAGAAAMSMSVFAVQTSAEDTPHYVDHSDFSDCVIGGADNPLYGSGIIIDGNPWLSKGSAQRHYQTFLHDDERDVNYVRMYSNSDKSGSNDGAGSMYMYQRDTSSSYTKVYGVCQFDVRLHAGKWQMMFGDFTDATSNTDYIMGQVIFDGAEKIKVNTLNGEKELCDVTPETWYTIRITVNNKLQEFSVGCFDMNGKQLGLLEECEYVQKNCSGVRTWCFAYSRGSTYYYDITNVTIAKSETTKFDMTLS